MMTSLRAVGKAWTQGVVELLLFFPFYLVISYFVLPVESLALWAVHLTFYYVAGFAVHQWLPLKRYLIYPLLLLIVVGIAYLFYSVSVVGAISVLTGGFLCIRGAKAYYTPWHELFQTKYYWIGLIFYFIASGLFTFIDVMDPYRSWIFWLGALSLAVTLLVSNQKILKQETLSGKYADPKVASPIVWQNRILIGLSLFIIVGIGLLGKVNEAIAWMENWISSLVSRIADIRSSMTGSSSSDIPGTSGEFGGEGGTNVDPSSFALSMQNIVFYVVFILLGIAALVLLFFAIKYGYRFLQKLIAWFRGNMGESRAHLHGEGAYEDRRENLFHLHKWRKQAADRMKDWLSRMLEKEPKWSDLHNNRDRIRYLYRLTMLRYMDKGYRYKLSNTPLETTEEILRWDDKRLYPIQDIVRYYNQARYDEDELQDAQRELEEINKQVER